MISESPAIRFTFITEGAEGAVREIRRMRRSLRRLRLIIAVRKAANWVVNLFRRKRKE